MNRGVIRSNEILRVVDDIVLVVAVHDVSDPVVGAPPVRNYAGARENILLDEWEESCS
jgi:hypothetical protein